MKVLKSNFGLSPGEVVSNLGVYCLGTAPGVSVSSNSPPYSFRAESFLKIDFSRTQPENYKPEGRASRARGKNTFQRPGNEVQCVDIEFERAKNTFQLVKYEF